MNAEKLHDALNYLDDGMILEVDKLRHKKKKTVLFRRIISVAACICIVATASFGIEHIRNLKDNSPFEENIEQPDQDEEGDIPPASENSALNDDLPPISDESAPAEDGEKDETSESYEDSAPADESAPEDEGPPLEDAPPSEEAPEEAPEDKEHQIVLTVTEITENGFKGYITDRNDIYDSNTDVTVIYKGEKLPETGDTVYVYFFGYDKTTVYAERIFFVKE